MEPQQSQLNIRSCSWLRRTYEDCGHVISVCTAAAELDSEATYCPICDVPTFVSNTAKETRADRFRLRNGPSTIERKPQR
jgi:hypothetical protein